MTDNDLRELVKCSKALLLMQLQAHLPEAERLKPEVLMTRAGFVPREIADLLGKKQAAIAKSIQRSGKAA